jgi:hypothetical protein
MHDASSCAGAFTRVDTRQARIAVASHGRISDSATSSGVDGSSHASIASGGTISGIRSWIGAMTAFGSVVTIVQLCSGSASGSPRGRHRSQSAPKAKGASSSKRMHQGCRDRLPATACHS